jgi:hypothetical protein
MRWKVAGVVVSAFVGAQFVQPVTASKPGAPAVLSGANAPHDVVRIVERSCRDCHTWNTAWPWYSRISPISWMMAHDVERGRGFLNFSEWATYSRAQKLAFVAAMTSAANQNRMPPAPYLFMHPEARLSDKDRYLIKTWARSEFRRLSKARSRTSSPATGSRGSGRS